ncbi:MAG: SsrA-binding protein SmpB [Patescibacteria group bacterium]|jgi:SsrA-binding protein
MPTLASTAHLRSNFNVLEDYEVGLVLTGAEVKSCKLGHVKLQGAYIAYENGGFWLKKALISPYQILNQRGYDPMRSRQVLLHRHQMKSLIGQVAKPGLTLLPESLYTTRHLVKLKMVLARGKKKYDKRADIKKRDVNRQIARALRQKI